MVNIFDFTPLKFNMEPENRPLEKEIPYWKPSFSGSMLNSGGVYNGIQCIFEIANKELWSQAEPRHLEGITTSGPPQALPRWFLTRP